MDAADTFEIVRDGETRRVRLYFAEAPSGPREARADRAIERAERFLRGAFDILTRGLDARSGDEPRVVFALARRDGAYLSAELVGEGLARIRGFPTAARWPGGQRPEAYLNALQRLEREAQRNRKGIWANAADSIQMRGADLATPNAPTPAANPNGDAAAPVNINAASRERLQELPGIGPAYAERIAAARPFESVDDLLRVDGIGESTLAELRGRAVTEALPPPPRTADFYRADLEKHLGDEVAVRVESVARTDAPAPDGFARVNLHTANRGREGGAIAAFIPEEFLASFHDRYATPGREFTGLFHRRQGEAVLVRRRR